MVSIIFPVYNVEKYIEKTIESFLNQSYKDFELVFVNDGSTDNSKTIIENKLKDANVKWQIIDITNSGQSVAKNTGFAYSKGEYVVYMDSDDVVSSDFIETLLKQFENNDIDISFCGFEFVKEQIPPTDENNNIKIYDRNNILNLFLQRKINFVVPSMMIKRKFIINNKILFNADIRFSEDQMFIWDCFFRCKKVAYVPKKMYGYYLREKSIMTASPYNRIMKAHEVFSLFCDNLKKGFPNDLEVINLILPRWEIATLYSAAKLVSYNEYSNMYKIMKGRTFLKRLLTIKEIKAYMLSIVFLFSKKLSFELCKRMN